jgi:hypothetical protein
VRIKFNYIAPLLAAGAAAVAIAAAPVAAAAPGSGQSCGASGTGTICQSPGNVQINDSPPPVQFYPYLRGQRFAARRRRRLKPARRTWTRRPTNSFDFD